MRASTLAAWLFLVAPGAAANSWSPAGRAGHTSVLSGVVGRVFLDVDADGEFDGVDQGLGGVGVLVGSGLRVETDDSGRFHVWRVPPGYDWQGTVPVELDPATIPAGVKVIPGRRRLVHLTPLALTALDFALQVSGEPPSPGNPPFFPGRQGDFVVVPGEGGLELQVSTTVEPGCRLWQGERELAVDERGRVVLRAPLALGLNRLLLSRQCPAGRLDFWIVEYHWVPRRRGGDVIVPGRVTLAASCRLPAAQQLPRRSALVSNCVAGSGEFRVAPRSGRKLAATGKVESWLLPLHAGSNRLGWRITGAESRPLNTSSEVRVASVAWSGLLMGNLLYSHGRQGGDELAGRLSGQLRAWLPGELRLYLGTSLEPLFTDWQLEQLLPAWEGQIHRRDIDLELGYPAAADEARLLDNNPAGSRYRLQLERRGGRLGWGQFLTDGNRPARVGDFSRALHGAYLSVDLAEQLAPSAEPQSWWLVLEGFYARPGDHNAETMPAPLLGSATGQARPAHDELLDTGGTLFFLSHGRLVEGSVRVQVEWRETRTGLARSTRRLHSGSDYQVDRLSGRLVLRRPLAQGGGATPVISPAPGSGHWAVLVVDYEYWDDDLDPDQQLGGANLLVGGRLGRNVGLGGKVSLVEQDGRSDYRLLASQVVLELAKDGQLWLGYARSQGRPGQPPGYSTDGGLSFAGLMVPPDEGARGEAWHAGARWDGEKLQAHLEFRRWLTGYADTSLAAAYDANQGLAEVRYRPWHWLELGGVFHGTRQWAGGGTTNAVPSGRLLDGQLQLTFRPTRPLGLSLAGSVEQAEGFWGSGLRSLLGARVSWQALDWLELFTGYQQLLSAGNEGLVAVDNTFARAGTTLTLADWQLGLSGGWGPECGNTLELAVNRRNEDSLTFAATTLSLDGSPLHPLRVTSGQSAKAGAGVMVTTANVFSQETTIRAAGQQAGIEVPLGGPWRAELSYQRSELQRAAAVSERWQWLWSPFADRAATLVAAPGRRNVLFGRLAYVTGKLALEASSEYRLDEQLPLVTRPDLTHHRQFVARLAGRWKPVAGFELAGRLAWAETMSAAGGKPNPGINSGRFLEASLGLAWRPERPGWFTLLARLGAGQDRRPEEFLSTALPLLASDWLSGSVALHLAPFSFLQPSLVMVPWYRRILTQPRADAPTTGQWGMLGMLRLGSEIAWGLGLAGEVRLGYASSGPETLPVWQSGLEVGYAAEVFFQLRQPEVGILRLGVGYSFSDLPDPTLAGAALLTGQEGIFLRLEGLL